MRRHLPGFEFGLTEGPLLLPNVGGVSRSTSHSEFWLKGRIRKRWEAVSVPESSQIGHSLFPPFPSSVNMKTNWDGPKNSILLFRGPYWKSNLGS